MSTQAAAPVLALVPPEPPRLVPAPATPAGLARRAKVRRVLTGACVTGALLPVPCVAAAPYLHEWVALGLVTSWVFLLPCGGFALLLAAAMWRTRDDLRALLLAGVSLVAGIALLGPAARAGMEAWVSSHAAELDAMAAARVAALAPLDRTGVVDEDRRFSASPEGGAMRRLGLGGPELVQGGLFFRTDAPFAPGLLYADGSLARWPAPCGRLRVTPLGGRWYLYDCDRWHRSEDG